MCIKYLIYLILHRLFCLKFDLATRKNHHVIGISVQYLENCVQKIKFLTVKEVEAAATSKYLKELIVNSLNDYNLDISNIFAITTDGGRNVRGAGQALLEESKSMDQMESQSEVSDESFEPTQSVQVVMEDTDDDLGDDEPESVDDTELCNEMETAVKALGATESLWCAVHLIQLAVHDFFKARNMTQFWKDLRATAVSARNAVNKLPRKQRPRQIKLSCPTRWNSGYLMVRIIIKLRVSVTSIITNIILLFL